MRGGVLGRIRDGGFCRFMVGVGGMCVFLCVMCDVWDECYDGFMCRFYCV